MAFAKGHALLVGVGSYQDTDLSVPITARDVEALAGVLQDDQAAGYPVSQVQILTGPAASRSRVLNELQALGQITDSQSTVVVFFCGHGTPAPNGGYYFLTHDARRTAGSSFDPQTVVSSADLVEAIDAIPAQKLLLIFNTCFSGVMAGSLQVPDPSLTPPSVDTIDAVLGSGRGRAVLSACRSNQKSWFLANADHTLFVQTLLNGLRGTEGVADRNGYITVANLYDYVYDQVSTSVKKIRPDVDQEPVLTIREQVGRFLVALHQGGRNLGEGDLGPTSEPTAAGLRLITEQQAQEARARIMAGRDIVSAASGDVVNTDTISGGVQMGSGSQLNYALPIQAGRDAIIGSTIDQTQYGGVRFEDRTQVTGSMIVGGNIMYETHPALDEETRQRLKELLDQLAQEADDARSLPREIRGTVMAQAEAGKNEVDQPNARASLLTRLTAITEVLKAAGEGVTAAAPLYSILKDIAQLVGVPLPGSVATIA